MSIGTAPGLLRKRDRQQLIYVRDGERQLWDDVAEIAVEMELPLSVLVSQAVREYGPVKVRLRERGRRRALRPERPI